MQRESCDLHEWRQLEGHVDRLSAALQQHSNEVLAQHAAMQMASHDVANFDVFLRNASEQLQTHVNSE